MNEKHIEEKLKYIEDFYTAVHGKWKISRLMVMYNEKNRFKEIQNTIPKITNRVRSKELKDLEANRLIIRKVYDFKNDYTDDNRLEKNHSKKVAGKIN